MVCCPAMSFALPPSPLVPGGTDPGDPGGTIGGRDIIGFSSAVVAVVEAEMGKQYGEVGEESMRKAGTEMYAWRAKVRFGYLSVHSRFEL